MMIKNKNKYNTHIGILVLVTMVFSVIGSFFNVNSFLYRISVLDLPEHQPFDGTVAPIKKVPNWVKLSSEKWDYNYDDLSSTDLVSLPFYDPDQLTISTDSLKWGNLTDDSIRNAKITYSVPYMGNYKLDGQEYGGSHLAVDIKIPMETPIYAIANGTVIKASDQSSGFGHHIVVQHNNFPTLNDPKGKEVIYSSYSHLSDISVQVGDVVEKGDKIALSGMSGTATTPHLHFQIDNDSAPWHPYWPFTWAEISEAGLDFFSAINEGFGQDEAIATTINPMKYVQKFKNVDSNDDEEEDENEEENVSTDESVPEEVPLEENEAQDEDENEEIDFEIEVKSQYYVGKDAEFQIIVNDKYAISESVSLASSKGNVSVEKTTLQRRHFNSEGINNNEFADLTPGWDRVKLVYDGETYYSDWFEIKGVTNGERFRDISISNEYYDAIEFLADEGIVKGYSDGTFRPDQTVNRAEALKFILEAIDANLQDGKLPFNDTPEDAWYVSYLFTGYAREIVNGNPDGSFRPADPVNRAEFFKILFNGMSVDINPEVEEKPYDDVEVSDWYAPYISYAKEIGLLDDDVKKIHADREMSRGEVAEAMYKLMEMED